jgi:zinc protease
MTRQFRITLLFTSALSLLLAIRVTPSAALEIKRETLKNGAIVLISEQHSLPMVTVAIAFDGGARRDPPGKDGLASLTARCLTLGTKDMDAADFNRKVDFMGSSVSVDASEDFAEAGITSLKHYEDDTLALLAAVLRSPALRDEDILRKRAEMVAAIKSAEQDPGYVAGAAFRKFLFGDRPYGHPPEGTADSVSRLTPDDVRSFYHQHYRLGSAVIAVVGDVTADAIKAELDKDLPGPTGTVAPQTPPSPLVVPPGIHVKMINRNVAQANLILGSPGLARSSPDYYRFKVMDYILGSGGFASRLMKTVRSKAGLAYSISSGAEAGTFVGSFQIVLETKNVSTNQALMLIIEQLKEIRDKPVTDDELSSAKKFLIGSFPLNLDRQSAIADYLLTLQIYNLGLDYIDRYPKYIEAVTREDVQQVARKFIHPDAMILVAVADQSQAKIDVDALQRAARGE